MSPSSYDIRIRSVPSLRSLSRPSFPESAICGISPCFAHKLPRTVATNLDGSTINTFIISSYSYSITESVVYGIYFTRRGGFMRVAIIGSGPAGFYAAEALLKRTDKVIHVDMFDRLPTPFGLVRGGVAPDHQSIKAVTRVYDKTAARPTFRFLGNVCLGDDVTVNELRQHYHQIVYAVGNEADRRLGIPGDGILRCTPATVFIGWYNGHPDYLHAKIDLSISRVAVIGNGNVALDAARILLRTPAELEKTDIAAHALAVLRNSLVREVFILGRRGP